VTSPRARRLPSCRTTTRRPLTAASKQRPKITSKRTHLGITIRRNQELPQAGQSELIKEAKGVEAPKC
jgi:hypothetical protein